MIPVSRRLLYRLIHGAIQVTASNQPVRVLEIAREGFDALQLPEEVNPYAVHSFEDALALADQLPEPQVYMVTLDHVNGQHAPQNLFVDLSKLPVLDLRLSPFKDAVRIAAAHAEKAAVLSTETARRNQLAQIIAPALVKPPCAVLDAVTIWAR